jgi:hypothetical protein
MAATSGVGQMAGGDAVWLGAAGAVTDDGETHFGVCFGIHATIIALDLVL